MYMQAAWLLLTWQGPAAQRRPAARGGRSPHTRSGPPPERKKKTEEKGAMVWMRGMSEILNPGWDGMMTDRPQRMPPTFTPSHAPPSQTGQPSPSPCPPS